MDTNKELCNSDGHVE